ncbi:MAG: hypothetical protein AB7I59_00165 [Geminicoccaceae bacterium]
MLFRNLIVGTVALAGSATMAHADLLAGGPLWGGASQKVALCAVFNAGANSARIVTFQIFQAPGSAPLPLQSTTCSAGAILDPNASCVFTAAIRNDRFYSCRVRVDGSAMNWSGALSIGNDQQVLSTTELR